MYGVMGLGLKSRNSQNYVGQPLLVPVPMPVPVRVHGNIKMSAIVAPKKNCRGANNFFSCERQVPIPRHTLQMQFETDAMQHSGK